MDTNPTVELVEHRHHTNWTMPWFPNAPGQADKNPFYDVATNPSRTTTSKNPNTDEMPWFPTAPGIKDANPVIAFNVTPVAKKLPLAPTNWTMPWMPNRPGDADRNAISNWTDAENEAAAADWDVPWFPNAPNEVDRNPDVSGLSTDEEECDDGNVKHTCILFVLYLLNI